MSRVSLISVLVAAAACQAPPDSSGRLSTVIFEDVVAPATATYLFRNHESFSYRSHSFRCGKFVYEYQGSDEEAVRFYKETMTRPPYSWTLTGEERPGSGSTALTFVKSEDRCTVDVDRVPRPNLDRKNNVEIRVRVNYRR